MNDIFCPDALKCNNEKIISYIIELKKQRDEVVRLIRKQEEEKTELAMEMERLAYKTNNLSKSLAQRMVARDRYDEAILEAEEYYDKLVKSSEALLDAVQKDYNELYETMDKKVGPDVNQKEGLFCTPKEAVMCNPDGGYCGPKEPTHPPLFLPHCPTKPTPDCTNTKNFCLINKKKP